MSPGSDQSFHQRVIDAIRARCGGNVAAAARDAGIEMTTLWRFVNEPHRAIALRTFACLCTWAGIDPRDVIEEFTA